MQLSLVLFQDLKGFLMLLSDNLNHFLVDQLRRIRSTGQRRVAASILVCPCL